MQLITWNTQWSRGVDGRVDPARIVSAARDMADFDVLCLQEVAANFPTLPGSRGENQFELFARLLPDYTPVPIAGVDIIAENGERAVFGNMILSRHPVLRVLRHQLPWPPDPDAISMPRVLAEVILSTPSGALRVMNTHLEYYSAPQRAAQVEAVRSIHAQACARARHARARGRPGSPAQEFEQSSRAILVGDFNFRPEDPLHARLQEPIDADTPRLVDAWEYLYPGQAHPCTIGVYDRAQWPEPYTCDFMFVGEDLLPGLRAMRADGATQASDHQPQLLVLA